MNDRKNKTSQIHNQNLSYIGQLCIILLTFPEVSELIR